jgi:hypothetical protein
MNLHIDKKLFIFLIIVLLLLVAVLISPYVKFYWTGYDEGQQVFIGTEYKIGLWIPSLNIKYVLTSYFRSI